MRYSCQDRSGVRRSAVCRVRENLYPPRNRVEVVPHVDEPLDTFGWRFGRTDRDYCRSRIECEPFGGRYDGEGFEWAVKGERTCRYTIVEMSLKPRDPDPEWLAFGDLKLESETPRSCERGCKGLTRFVRNAAADEERSGLCHLAWVLSVGTEDTRNDRERPDPVPTHCDPERDEAESGDRVQHQWEGYGVSSVSEIWPTSVVFDRDRS